MEAATTTRESTVAVAADSMMEAAIATIAVELMAVTVSYRISGPYNNYNSTTRLSAKKGVGC